MKTLRYTENNIHDFAWFADKRFNVRKGTVKLPDSDREVTTWVMFTDQEAYLWKNAISYVNDAISVLFQNGSESILIILLLLFRAL